MKQADLDARIAAAFTDKARSEDFEPLIRDAEAASTAATAAAKRAREKALEPTCPPAEVAAARRAMDDAAFVADRLTVAAARLRERHRAVAAKEEDARRRIVYDQAVRERDKLAAELADVYPPLVVKLVELFNRIAQSDREIAMINSVRLPEGAPRILVAELVARGLLGFVSDGITTPSLLQELRLPAFGSEVHHPYEWEGGAPTMTMMQPPVARIVKV